MKTFNYVEKVIKATEKISHGLVNAKSDKKEGAIEALEKAQVEASICREVAQKAKRAGITDEQLELLFNTISSHGLKFEELEKQNLELARKLSIAEEKLNSKPVKTKKKFK